MRHLVAKKRLSRSTSHRIAMMRNIVTSLIEHERITTTLTKAKELRKLADQMISLGKQGTLHARRRALSVVRKKSAVSKLFGDLAARFQTRAGGYTRVLKVGFRHGDNAEMAIIEYVDYQPKKAAQKNESSDSKETESKKEKTKAKVVKAPRKKRETTKAEEKSKEVGESSLAEKLAKKPRKKTQKVEKVKED